jgi:glycerophosphoryl diester phosphodiesterase
MTTRPVLFADGPLAFAHRGGAALWPENTLLAFQHALELGVDFIESDLRMTRDGALVLHHDARVDRTTNGAGAVADLTLEGVKRLDAGYRFTRDGRSFPYRNASLTVPTLEEALSAFPSLRYNLEIKDSNPAVVGRVVDFLALSGAWSRVILAVRDEAMARALRGAAGGRVATAASAGEVMRFFAASRIGLEGRLEIAYDALEVPAHTSLFNVVDARFVAAAQRRQLPVYVYTVDQPSEMRRLLDLGVDGLMSDRVDRLMETLEHHGAVDRLSRV